MTDERHLEIIDRLSAIEVVTNDTAHRLFGNGEPGEISNLSGRIGKLEEEKWRLIGVGAVIMGILQFFTGSGVLSLDKLMKAVQGMH